MFCVCVESALGVWRESLVGGAMIVLATVVGWRVGRAHRVWPVRVVSGWLTYVVDPLIASRSWLRRASIIAANNASIAAAVVAIGSLGQAAWLAVGGVGLALGVALRLMCDDDAPAEDQAGHTPTDWRRSVPEAIGLVLNLLEVPAIMLAAGAALAQGAMSSRLTSSEAWSVYGWVVLPLLVVGAAGEALWMTVNPDLPGLWRRR